MKINTTILRVEMTRMDVSFFVFAGVMGVVSLGIAQILPTNTSAWHAPTAAAARANPEKDNPEAAKAGRGLFMQACVTCHAEDGSGRNSIGANLRTQQAQKQSDGALFWKITTGNPPNGMPSFDSLSDTDRWDIVCFLRTFRASDDN